MKIAGRLNLDKVGACASGLCAIHCLLSGVALGVLSVMGLGFIGSVTTDIVFIGVTLSIASIAIFTGIRRHHSLVPAALFCLGVSAIVVSHVLIRPEQASGSNRILTTVLSVGGACLLVAFHFVNLRMQRACAVSERQGTNPHPTLSLKHEGEGRHSVG